MEWGLVWMLLILKIPVFMLLYIIWWAVKDPPRPELADEEKGGSDRPRKPRPIAPLHPRRGPHSGSGDARIPPPARTRTATARARVERD
jgi:hypothetical protein